MWLCALRHVKSENFLHILCQVHSCGTFCSKILPKYFARNIYTFPVSSLSFVILSTTTTRADILYYKHSFTHYVVCFLFLIKKFHCWQKFHLSCIHISVVAKKLPSSLHTQLPMYVCSAAKWLGVKPMLYNQKPWKVLCHFVCVCVCKVVNYICIKISEFSFECCL